MIASLQYILLSSVTNRSGFYVIIVPKYRNPVDSSTNPPSEINLVTSELLVSSQLSPPSCVKKTCEASCDMVRPPEIMIYPKLSLRKSTFLNLIAGKGSVINDSSHVLPWSVE